MGDRDYFTEGMRAYHRGDYATAVRRLGFLTEGKDLQGRLARYYCAMGHRASAMGDIRAGRFCEAASRLRQTVALIGNRADLVEYLMFVYARTAQYERCADAAEVMSRLTPDDAMARVRLAQAQWRTGRKPLAIMTLTRGLRELGDKARLHLNLGLFYAAGEDYDKAFEHLTSAVKCDCTWSDAQHYLGLVASVRGDFALAAEAFQRACNLEPGNLVFSYQLCLAADAAARMHRPVTLSLPEFNRPSATSPVSTGRFQAMRQLAEYAAAEPDFVETFLALPPSEADEELFGVMSSVLKTALVYHDDYADLHYYAGVTSARLGRFDEARRYTARAVRINPRYVKALIHLAEIDTRRGATEQAIKSLRKAVRAGGDFPDVHARLGELMSLCGKTEPARKHYNRALELKPQYRRAADGIESLAA